MRHPALLLQLRIAARLLRMTIIGHGHQPCQIEIRTA
jgi:hypothetical protein